MSPVFANEGRSVVNRKRVEIPRSMNPCLRNHGEFESVSPERHCCIFRPQKSHAAQGVAQPYVATVNQHSYACKSLKVRYIRTSLGFCNTPHTRAVVFPWFPYGFRTEKRVASDGSGCGITNGHTRAFGYFEK